jgi:site-specific recombinase XerD
MHGGSLSSSSINKIIQSVNTFAKYLNSTGKHVLDITPRRITSDISERSILSTEEIKALYESTFLTQKHNTQAMGQRDRAIIAIFYGCGLRKDEGTRLNITDIDLNKKLVFVRKGKGNKQRYVPIASKHAEDMRAYLEEGRYWFLEHHYTRTCYRHSPVKKSFTDAEAFFINQEGKRMQSFYQRFEYMKERAGIEKDFSTHSLRHSIATHLLQSGMPIEEIAKFLGHGSLESTQIYTHIVNQLKREEHEHTGILLLSER